MTIITHGARFCSEFHKSQLGPLLFNIFICNMFYFCENFDVASYGDNSTPYCEDEINTSKSDLLFSGNSGATATIDNN